MKKNETQEKAVESSSVLLETGGDGIYDQDTIKAVNVKPQPPKTRRKRGRESREDKERRERDEQLLKEYRELSKVILTVASSQIESRLVGCGWSDDEIESSTVYAGNILKRYLPDSGVDSDLMGLLVTLGLPLGIRLQHYYETHKTKDGEQSAIDSNDIRKERVWKK